MGSKKNFFTRRDFLKSTAVTSAALLAAQTTVFAQKSERIRVGLIGCGGRGTGALKDCLEAGKQLGLNLEVTAVADIFKDRAENTATEHKVPKEQCFVGFDAYRKVMRSDIDVVLLATSPNFRPLHFETAVKAGKHVFMEKPVCVDPPGGRRIIEAGELAKQKALTIVAGTQRRHQLNYLRNHSAVQQGLIGKITGGCLWWCGGQLWYKERKEGESDAEYLVRNWVNFTEMSGDHIVEQHVHNLDIANWYIGHPPVKAIGFGGRARRKTGNQYDFFSIEYDYSDQCIIHSMCRQVNGCYGRVSEYFIGTEGAAWGEGKIQINENIKIPDFKVHNNPYVQEHIALLDSVVNGKKLNEARQVAEASLTAVMGRISAYTGKLVRWVDLTDPSINSPWYNFVLTPTAEDFEKGEVKAPEEDVIAIPGTE